MTIPTNPEGAKLADLIEQERLFAQALRDTAQEPVGGPGAQATFRNAADAIDRLADAFTAPLAVGGASDEDVIAALEPLARLIVPTKPNGNAGFYSIRHADIERARSVLALIRSERG